MIDEKKLLENRPEYLNPNMTDEIRSAYNEGWNGCNKYWFNIIEEQLKINKWVLCNKRLPDANVSVLVTYKNDNNFVVDTDWWYKSIDTWFYFGEKVIAWQPLPEPYKED